jgi:hypothetical protein
MKVLSGYFRLSSLRILFEQPHLPHDLLRRKTLAGARLDSALPERFPTDVGDFAWMGARYLTKGDGGKSGSIW